jgi:hypothetical protein
MPSEELLRDSMSAIAKAILEAGGNTEWPTSQTIDGLELRCTCSSHPEQYDVYDGEKQVAYFRLRHGEFTVDVPDCGGETIYKAQPNGDGLFDANERQKYLTEAVQAVCKAVGERAFSIDKLKNAAQTPTNSAKD